MKATRVRRALLGLAAGCIAGCLVWLAGFLLTSIAGARGVGPFGEFLRALHNADAAHGWEAAMRYMLSDQSMALARRMAFGLFWTTLLPASIVAGLVSGIVARASWAISLAVGTLACAGPLLLGQADLSLYFGGLLLPCALCMAVSALAALSVGLIRRSP